MRRCWLVAAILVGCLPACATWNTPRAPAPVVAPDAQSPSTPPANASSATESVKPAPPPPSVTAKPPATPHAGATANAPPHKSPPAPAKSRPPAKTEPSAPPTPAEKPSAPTLDLAGLEQRLKDTHAVGVFTKLTLKNQVDDLLSQFRSFHQSTQKIPPDPLRRQYDALILKVLSLLQDSDPQLASDISSSREALWGILIDPQKFAKI